MNKNPNTAMNTMTDTINKLTVQGYTEAFQVTDVGLKALSDGTIFSADEVSITNFFRFEGQSDPSDNAIVYVVQTNDGKMGLLIDAFGSDADHDIGKFIVDVQEFQKKIKIV
jgi:hypothetical protein